jgi:glycosyltransferase involved in cell wall biosynthesis
MTTRDSHESQSQPPVLGIVVPCYNEEAILTETHAALGAVISRLVGENKIAGASFICYVNDGSADKTWSIISDLAASDPRARGIKLSRNFGHQNALLAGMLDLQDSVDCVVTIDADLQDDVNCIDQMIDRHREGYKVVYGVRENRDTDTFSKRSTAQLFYKIMEWLGVKTIYNHADFRLIDARVLKELARYGEVNLFLRGVFPQLGFRTAMVTYSRKERTAGETKYPFRKMLAFAWEGITSFSGFPLRMIFLLGCVILAVSVGLSIWALIPVIQGRAIHGWASTVIPIFVFAGLQMMSVGILGEYLAKVYQEVKARPRYIIERHAPSDAPDQR